MPLYFKLRSSRLPVWIAATLFPMTLFSATSLFVNVAGDANIVNGGTFSGNSGDLRGVLNQTNRVPGNYDITFGLGANTITLGAMLPLINLTGGNTITINGQNGAGPQIILNGANSWRGFFVQQGNVTIQNMTIQNVTAVGGFGGGGGMGAGAALMVDGVVNNVPGFANVTLSNVQMNTATVRGGGGVSSLMPSGGGGLGVGSLATTTSNSGTNRGGGGGFGGNGAAGGSCGGGGINCGASHTGTGGALGNGGGIGGAIIANGFDNIGGKGGPPNGPSFIGGIFGGGGGGGFSTASGGGGGGENGGQGGGGGGGGGYGGGGGSGGTTAVGTDGNGGNGGFGGGGGCRGNIASNFSGSGGFGGGGADEGGNGGFGGGGGQGFTFAGGMGGVGGGQGASNGGGGGAGLGGALFIRSGTVNILMNSSTNGANTATGGMPAGAGTSGIGRGNDFFFISGTTVTLDAQASGNTITVTNSIADDSSDSISGFGITPGTGTGARMNIGSSLGGTVQFLAANTYKGGTTINSGTLQIGNNTSLGGPNSAGTTVLNGGALQLKSGVNVPATQTLGIRGFGVGGVGALTKDAGVSATYSGPINVNATSIIGTNGAGTLALSGGVALNGNSLILIGGGTITINNTGISGASPNSNLLVEGVTTIVNTANTYNGFTLVSNFGTLRAGSTAVFPPSSPVTVDNGSTLDLNNFFQTIASLAGSGSVTLGSALLETGSGGSTTFSGAITGTGGILTKTGASTFTLTGMNNLGGGSITTVSQGTLLITDPGELISTAVFVNTGATLHIVDSDLISAITATTITNDGTLSGIGTITGNVINNGTVSPGNSIGVLTIVGNYTQTAGATLFMEVSPTGSDELIVTGTATIDPGATLSLFFTPGLYPVSNTYTLLHANAGLAGTFTNVPDNTPIVQYVVRYDANNVFLDITIAKLASISCGGNIGKVASYLDSLTPMEGSDLGTVIEVLDAFGDLNSLNQALAQLSPAPYKNLILAQEENVFTISRGISDHLNTYMNTCCRRGVDRKRRVELWATAFGDWAGMGNRSSDACQADTTYGYHARGTGGLFGVDYSFTNQCVFGATGAYSYSDVHVNNSLIKGHINSVYGALYTMIRGHGMFLDATLIGGYDRFNASRKIQFSVDTPGIDIASIDRTARTKHGGWNFDAHLDGGFIIDQWRAVEIRPFFAFDCLLVHEGAFREHGAESLNIRVQATNNTLLRSEAGLNLSHCFRVSHGKWIPQVRASAVWENFSSNCEFYQARFAGQPGSFSAKTRNPNRTLVSPGAGVTGVFYDDTLLFSFDYLGEFGHSYHNQVGKIEFSWLF